MGKQKSGLVHCIFISQPKQAHHFQNMIKKEHTTSLAISVGKMHNEQTKHNNDYKRRQEMVPFLNTLY